MEFSIVKLLNEYKIELYIIYYIHTYTGIFSNCYGLSPEVITQSSTTKINFPFFSGGYWARGGPTCLFPHCQTVFMMAYNRGVVGRGRLQSTAKGLLLVLPIQAKERLPTREDEGVIGRKHGKKRGKLCQKRTTGGCKSWWFDRVGKAVWERTRELGPEEDKGHDQLLIK